MNLEAVQPANIGMGDGLREDDETEEQRLQAKRDVLRILKADKSEENAQAVEDPQADGPDKRLMEDLKLLEQGRRSEQPRTLFPPKSLEDTRAFFDASETIRDELAELDSVRPKTRAECLKVPRPCPLVGCKYNNFLDVNSATGTITLNHPGLTPDQMPPAYSCALDVADRYHNKEMPMEVVGTILNVSRTRIRQIEDKGLSSCAAKLRSFRGV